LNDKPAKKIVFWRTDKAKKFQGKLFQSMLSKHRITQETGIPYAYHQMDKMERANRTIINTVRTMFIDTKLPQAL
jgi:transposase InsO family protein